MYICLFIIDFYDIVEVESGILKCDWIKRNVTGGIICAVVMVLLLASIIRNVNCLSDKV